jgi:hypothetical protein
VTSTAKKRSKLRRGIYPKPVASKRRFRLRKLYQRQFPLIYFNCSRIKPCAPSNLNAATCLCGVYFLFCSYFPCQLVHVLSARTRRITNKFKNDRIVRWEHRIKWARFTQKQTNRETANLPQTTHVPSGRRRVDDVRSAIFQSIPES